MAGGEKNLAARAQLGVQENQKLVLPRGRNVLEEVDDCGGIEVPVDVVRAKRVGQAKADVARLRRRVSEKSPAPLKHVGSEIRRQDRLGHLRDEGRPAAMPAGQFQHPPPAHRLL